LEPPDALIVDLVGGAARSLRLLDLPLDFTLSRSAQHALADCKQIVSLSANVSCLVALRNLRHLLKLRIRANSEVPPIWLGGRFPDLRRLCVEWSVFQNAAWGGWMLVSLCSAAPNLTQLTVNCGQLVEDDCCCDCTLLQGVSQVVSSLPDLTTLDIHCVPDLLPHLHSLLNLRYLNAEVLCHSDQLISCTSQVSLIKELQPNIKACIKITVKPVIFMWQ
jgi:hypothetical protein